MHYSVGDFEWQTMELGADAVEVGGTATFEIPVSAADVAEDCKSAENILPAGTQLVVTAQMTKNGVPFGQMFTKTVTVKPSMAGKLVSNTIPDSISPDGKQKAALTFVNTGSFMWSGSKLDAATPGLRIAITGGARYLSDTGANNDTEATHGYNHGEIPSGYVVKPGETYTFHLDVHTYPNPLSTTDVATGKTTSNTAAGMNFIVNTQGDLAGNQQFSDNFKYTFEKYLESEIELNEVIINDDNTNGDDVSIAAKNIPDVMTVNEIRKIELTLENTGTSTWYTTDHTDKSKSHQIGTDESGNPIYCWGTKNHVCTVDLMVLDETFQIYNGYTEQNEDGTLVGAWGSKKGKGYLIPGLNDYAPGQSKTVSPYIYAPSEPGVYVLRFAMTNPHTGETFRTGYEKVIRVIEPDTERESDDGKTVYLDANYRPALPREIVHLDDAKMSGVEMASKFLSVHAPQTMAAGEAAPIAVTVKNVGTARWNRFRGQDASDVATNARLGVFTGGIGGNFRVTKDQAGENGWVGDQNMIELDDKFHVYPGSKMTFTSYLHAPQTPGVYTLRLQMSNAFGVSSFGEDLRIPVVVGMNAEIYYVGNFEQINNLEDSLRIGVKNMGDAAWEPLQDPATEAGYALKYTFGEETSYLSMPQTVAPGKSVDFNCMSEKPRESGEYPLTAEIIYRAEDGTEYTVGDPVETLVVIEDYHLVEQTLSTEEELAVTDNTYGAEIVSVKLPERMEPGAKMPIAITVKNTGKANLVSKYGQETGNAEGLRVYFVSQGFDSKYKEETWQSNPTAFDVVNTTDYKLALEKKFFVFNQNGDGRTVSRYGVTINDRGNNECNCLDMKNGTTLASGETYTYVGWIVAPYTAGSYDIRLSAEADVNKEIRSKTRTVNITVGEHDKIVVKDFLNETYPVYRTSSYSRNGLFNSALLNADYYIANQAFFFDLSPDDNIAPKDDREQPVGTDVDTLRKMFYAQMQQAQSRRSKGNLDVEGTGIFTIGGFLPWHIKYCFDSDSESTMDAFHGEFHMIDIASEYGGQTDADAFGTIGLSNASVYQHIAVNLSGSKAVQTQKTFNPKTYCTEKYDPNKNYIMFYMGDYDGGSWVGNLLNAIYNEKDANGNITRGELPIAWQINTNLADRIPHVYNMLYKNATAKDFFVVGNNGTGYFNVHWALNPRDESITAKQTAQIRTDWIAYNQSENREFSLGVQGFIQPTTASRLSSQVMDVYRQTTPYGVADAQGVRIAGKKLHHGIYDAQAADGGTPFLYNLQLARLDDPATFEANRNNVVGSIHNAMVNNDGMVSASSVKWLPSQVEAIVDYYNRVYPNEKLTVVDPYTYF
ncbi:MAG: hypothetical protein IIV87_04080, partial [Oscillospiraceae bacterium]|nr:hypothetical protein [Oscillospiraceae bacterium]